MGKQKKLGNKLNSWLNGEWGKQKKDSKRHTAHMRRNWCKKVIRSEVRELLDNGPYDTF